MRSVPPVWTVWATAAGRAAMKAAAKAAQASARRMASDRRVMDVLLLPAGWPRWGAIRMTTTGSGWSQGGRGPDVRRAREWGWGRDRGRGPPRRPRGNG